MAATRSSFSALLTMSLLKSLDNPFGARYRTRHDMRFPWAAFDSATQEGNSTQRGASLLRFCFNHLVEQGSESLFQLYVKVRDSRKPFRGFNARRGSNLMMKRAIQDPCGASEKTSLIWPRDIF